MTLDSDNEERKIRGAVLKHVALSHVLETKYQIMFDTGYRLIWLMKG